MLENPEVLKVAQNAKFEYEMLKQQVGITLAGMFDTMLAERLVDGRHRARDFAEGHRAEVYRRDPRQERARELL